MICASASTDLASSSDSQFEINGWPQSQLGVGMEMADGIRTDGATAAGGRFGFQTEYVQRLASRLAIGVTHDRHHIYSGASNSANGRFSIASGICEATIFSLFPRQVRMQQPTTNQ